VAGTLGRGGAERQLVYMLRSLLDKCVSARLLCLTTGEPLEEEIRDLGVPVEYVGSQRAHLARLGEIFRSLQREPVDIVQSAHFYTNTYAALAGSALGVRSIGAVRNDLLSEVRGNWPYGWGHLLLPEFLIANSRLARQRVLQSGRSQRRVFLVENVVDTDRYGGHRGVARGERGPRLLFVGRLVEQKRPDRFLRLVARLRRETGEPVEARLVGDGPQRPALESMLAALDVPAGCAMFLGEVDDLRPLYEWADLLVLTSDHEGTPNVVLEAMASGLAVLATAVGGVPDLICHGGGLLVRADDEAALFRAAYRLVYGHRSTEQIISEGRRFVSAARSLDGLGDRLSCIYTGMVARGNEGSH
jgi:glycosyltransferase involved in cell wall biosynthesis